jgi:hypothetical protein
MDAETGRPLDDVGRGATIGLPVAGNARDVVERDAASLVEC